MLESEPGQLRCALKSKYNAYGYVLLEAVDGRRRAGRVEEGTGRRRAWGGGSMDERRREGGVDEEEKLEEVGYKLR